MGVGLNERIEERRARYWKKERSDEKHLETRSNMERKEGSWNR